MHLKLRDLAVFHAVMLTGSVSKAAERLGLTQPAVSMALSKLEERLGYPLFNRSRGNFYARPEALLLHEDAEMAILAFERFSSHAQLIGRGAEGLVRVGSIGSTAIHFLPEMIARFAATRSSVEIELQVRSSMQLVTYVGNGQTDIGLTESPVASDLVEAVNVAIPCVCIMRDTDPLAAEPLITPQHLADRKLVSVFEEHQMDRALRAAFEDAGVPFRSTIRCYFFAIMRNLVAKSAGVAIVDAINGCAEAHDGVTWRPFLPRLTFDVAVITRKDTGLTAPAREFLDLTVAGLRAVDAQVDAAEARARAS